jgi:hypothetical protein
MAVIGDVFDDCIARPAVGAVNKWIAVAAVMGIKKFAAAIVTRAYIWRNEG